MYFFWKIYGKGEGKRKNESGIRVDLIEERGNTKKPIRRNRVEQGESRRDGAGWGSGHMG